MQTNPYSRPDKLYGMKKLSARHLHRLSMKAGSRVVNSSDKTKRESSQDRPVYVRQRSGSLGTGAPADASKSPPPGQRTRGFSIDDDDDDDGKSSSCLVMLCGYL